MKTILQAARLLLVLTLLTGIVYPLAVTGIAKVAFPRAAGGSLVYNGETLVGSHLLAQKFESDGYFWPRASSADYATVVSGASNKGPINSDLVKLVGERREQFGPDAPDELLTASASGLDPHLSPAAAAHQIARVAAARDLPNERVTAFVNQATEAPQFGFLGEPRINVLRLNLLLDGHQ
jgi:K+-transporting ATPase ATPase C chain